MSLMFSEDLDAVTLGKLESREYTTSEHDDIFFLHARCHPRAGTWCGYKYGTNVMTVYCVECGAFVSEFAVASKYDMLKQKD